MEEPKFTKSLSELLKEGEVITIEPKEDEMYKDFEADAEYEKQISNHIKMLCVGEGLEDEDAYENGEPFDILAKRMVNLTPDGKIKKRILRKGYGETPGNRALVRVHYNAYQSDNPEPFDCSYARNRPHTFTVNKGEVIIGLDLAVQSMCRNEKSQFLVDPYYAYGALGCLGRVAANATILFEVELLDIVESGAAEEFSELPEEEKKDFDNIYKYCQALCEKGKMHFQTNKRNAIKEYNTAAQVLEDAVLTDYNDQEKQQGLLLKLYSNLLVCYTAINEPRKACNNYNLIKRMAMDGSIRIPAKCHFNYAKCQRMLGDFGRARAALEKARIMEPNNTDIIEEFIKLEKERQDLLEKQKNMAKAMFKVQ